MKPGRVDRAEATATTQLLVRHDGCWLGCRHAGGTCFGGSVIQVQPEEVTVQQQREADAERGQIQNWGLKVTSAGRSCRMDSWRLADSDGG